MNRVTDRAYRRRLLTGAACVVAAPHVLAQDAGRPRRICWLTSGQPGGIETYERAFVQRLNELGFFEGRNIVIERRGARGVAAALPDLATDLARSGCDLFFAGGIEPNLVALKAVGTQPIVFMAVDFDPTARGHVASLARPGGRITGVSTHQSVLPAKRLELLKAMVPALRTVGVLANSTTLDQVEVVREAAPRLGLEPLVVSLEHPSHDFRGAFAQMRRGGAQALLVLGSGLWVAHRPAIIEAALQARLPSMFHNGVWCDLGGLMSYGFNFPDIWRRGAEMVARVLGGADTATMPMEQPARYELVINRKTARALGLSIPQSVLLRADHVLE
jgi:putative tryptophan/tyrosine transport system substrate-binding protein